ncbi:MAG: Gfo/Idh/MocA family protein [Candidatus Zipacnadales bacterium]
MATPRATKAKRTAARGPKKDDTIGFGIIGCGMIAPFHAKSVLAAEGAELVACCDIVEEKAKAFAQEYGIKYVYRDLEDMLRQDDVQAVCICTPSGLHAQHGIAAAQAGKHIMCEKPLDVTLEAIDALIRTAEECKVKLGGIFQRRTYPVSHLVRDAVRTGKIGKVVLGDCYQKLYRSHEYYASGDWRATWELDGGGALMNQGVHGIDLLCWIMGRVKRVCAFTRHLVRNIPVEDTAVAIVEYETGALGVIEGTTSVTPGEHTRFEFNGDDGTIILEESKILKWHCGEEREPPEIKEVDTGGGGVADPTAIGAGGHMVLIQDLVNAIKEDREPMIPGREARRAVELILAIYASERSGGCPVELPLC